MALSEALTLAIETLSWMELDGLSERSAFVKASRQLGIGRLESLKLAHMIVLETVKRRNFIDRIIHQEVTPENFAKLTLGIKNFLRIYVYWTKFKKPSLQEAVSLAKLGRKILGSKELKEVELALGRLLPVDPKRILRECGSEEERVALRTGHPTWLVNYCFKFFGKPRALKFFEFNARFKHVYLRVNTLKGDEGDLRGEIEEEGVELEEVEGLKHVYLLKGTRRPLTKLASYRRGFFHIQDKSSCFAALATAPRPGDAVVDACAAPGGKTSFLAQLMENKGRIYSLDYSKERMDLWRKEMVRMGVKNAEPILCDVTKPLPLKLEADAVILDPPCTGTGALMKVPSMRWKFSPRMLKRFQGIQLSMLENCSRCVKVGGKLVYSTCSITLEENELLIEKFLKFHPNFTLVPVEPPIGSPGFRGQSLCRRLYPHLHSSEGFFIAKMEREY